MDMCKIKELCLDTKFGLCAMDKSVPTAIFIRLIEPTYFIQKYPSPITGTADITDCNAI